MFISVLELFKIGVGPSSSHTMGPMNAAVAFRKLLTDYLSNHPGLNVSHISCVLKGSLAFTGIGHCTDRAIVFGLHGYQPAQLAQVDINATLNNLKQQSSIELTAGVHVGFDPDKHVVFDRSEPLPEHPNGMIFQLHDQSGNTELEQRYFSIGGGFISTLEEIQQIKAPLKMQPDRVCPYGFASARAMLRMSQESGLTIAQMKRQNELETIDDTGLNQGMDAIWDAMQKCLETGLETEGELPGGLHIQRRAKHLASQLRANPESATLNDWLCAYAMAVNEENAAGHLVVTAPTNGAAGVIPAVLYYFMHHEAGRREQIWDFLLVAAAIGGLIKHRSSISGAEVGCQGEVGSAAAMAAAGLCAVKGGSSHQIENAAEIALEHHLGMTCDPVKGLVQVPCIERNGFGAIKAYTASSLALRGSGQHFMPLDSCIAAMKQTGQEMSNKFKETALGGLAVSLTEC